MHKYTSQQPSKKLNSYPFRQNKKKPTHLNTLTSTIHTPFKIELELQERISEPFLQYINGSREYLSTSRFIAHAIQF